MLIRHIVHTLADMQRARAVVGFYLFSVQHSVLAKSVFQSSPESSPSPFQVIVLPDLTSVAPIIGSAIGNTLYRLIFSYRLSDRYMCQITTRSDIIAGQSQVYC